MIYSQDFEFGNCTKVFSFKSAITKILFSDSDFYNDLYEQFGEHEYFPLDYPKCAVKFSDTTPGCGWKR